MSRKPRSDSNLKTLPEEQQEAIFSRLSGKGGSYEKVRAWLFAEWDIKTSVGALQAWYSWYSLRQHVTQESNFVDSLVGLMKEEGEFTLSTPQLAEFGNLLFMARAAREQDPKVWATILKLVNQREALGLDSRRVALLEQKAAQADAVEKVASDKNLTAQEKEQRIKQIFGS